SRFFKPARRSARSHAAQFQPTPEILPPRNPSPAMNASSFWLIALLSAIELPSQAQFTAITNGPVVKDGGDSTGCAWGDYDNDGFLDLFVSNEQGQNNFLFHNNGDGSFAKIISGNIVNDGGASYGCTWGDYDNDGFLDLFVANLNENNFLYHNNGDGTFTKVTSGRIVSDGGASQGCAWGDYDNDGLLDLFVANRNQINFLYHNDGNGAFTAITNGAIVNDVDYSWSPAWVDYDNDGFLDLFVANGPASGAGQNDFLY